MPYPHINPAGLYMYVNSDVFPLLMQQMQKKKSNKQTKNQNKRCSMMKTVNQDQWYLK